MANIHFDLDTARFSRKIIPAIRLMDGLLALREKYSVDPSTENQKLLMLFLRAALRDYPDDEKFWHFAGQEAENAGQFAVAAKLYQRGLKAEPECMYLLMSAAKLEFSIGQYGQAEHYIQRLLNLNETDIKTLGLATQVALAQGKYADAEHYVKRQLDLDSKDCLALGLTTQVALAQGKFAEAEYYVEQQLSLDGKAPVTLGLATQVALAQGKYAEAEHYLQRRLDLDGTNPVALGLATQVALAQGKFAEAESYIQQLDLDGTNVVALGLATQVALAQGKHAEAERYIQRQLDLDGTNVVALGLATQVALAQGKHAEAERYIQRQLDLDGTNPVALGLATQVALAQGKYDQALAGLSAVIQEQLISNKVLTYLKAKTYLLKGEVGQTIKLLHPLVEKHANPAFITLLLACYDENDPTTRILAGLIEKVLPEVAFSRLWKNSRDIHSKTGILDAERNLFYGTTFWNSDATAPINLSALEGATEIPTPLRQARDKRRHGFSEQALK